WQLCRPESVEVNARPRKNADLAGPDDPPLDEERPILVILEKDHRRSCKSDPVQARSDRLEHSSADEGGAQAADIRNGGDSQRCSGKRPIDVRFDRVAKIRNGLEPFQKPTIVAE